jgi:disulfide bond formation protein DsbB
MLYTILAAAVLFLSVFPIGIAAYILGFIYGESPCVLCWEQRVGMMLIALIGLFVLRYGAKPKYLGLAILVGLYGMYMAIRHSGLHLARDIGQGFAVEILGAHTYTWSFVIFFCCTAAMGALLMMARPSDLAAANAPRRLTRLDGAAFAVFLVMIAGNIVQAFASTGPPPFVGQSDPVRFSFNPRHWVWSLDEFKPAPISWRGRWAVEKPDVASVDPSPATGPFRNFPALPIGERRGLALPLRGRPTGLAYDAGTDRFALTTEHGVYLTDGSMSRVERYTVVDPMFSVDLARFAAAAFLDSQRVIAVSENKSFVVLRERGTSGADADVTTESFRFFLESPAAFDEVSRGRFATIRAKMSYIMSAAADPATKSILTVTVPNARGRRLIVSRFDSSDMTLSEEFVPKGAPGLDRLYVTAATIAGGRLYLLSAAHATLVTVDLASRSVIDARTIPGLERPTGIAIKGGALHVVTADGQMIRCGEGLLGRNEAAEVKAPGRQ